MAFALTSCDLYGIERDEGITKKFHQIAILTITAANTDIDLDLGDNAGTFWDAVDATTLGASALAAIKDIGTRVLTLKSFSSEAIMAKFQVATATNAGEYSVTVQNNRPNILFDSGDAPTAYTVVLEWILKDGHKPVFATIS